MRLQASPELLKFAYDAGLGEKNAMGFGCSNNIHQIEGNTDSTDYADTNGYEYP
jgi:hypothetical protein